MKTGSIIAIYNSSRTLRKLQEGFILHFGHNALDMTDNDLCDHSHYISAHVDGRRTGDGGGKCEERMVQRRRKTMEVSEGGWVVLSRESRIVCREIVARWRIPDCERALLASGQKNRCEVTHAFGSVEGLSEHFLSPYGIRISHHLSACIFFTPFSARARLRATDEEEINTVLAKSLQRDGAITKT